MVDLTKITFKRLDDKDLPLIYRWLNQDFVYQWFGKEKLSFDQVRNKYLPRIRREVPTEPYLILYNMLPIGYVQMYLIDDHKEYASFLNLREKAAGFDIYIGEKNYLHRGLGPEIMRIFLRDCLFQVFKVSTCVVGPEPKNEAAIRAYKKAGFKYLKTVRLPNSREPEYLLRITKAELYTSELKVSNHAKI